MLHGLYRVYLYIVYIAMLIFATVGLSMFLQTILAFTVFKGPYNVPTSTNIVQAGTFAVVSWLIAGLVGGLHYWLIRRDLHSDHSANEDAVRAFFLNFAEILTLPLAVGMGASTISMLGQSSSSVSGSAAFAISALALWVWLDWERRRIQPNSGTAITFQRIHLYAVQLILLFILFQYWISNVGQLVDAFFYGGKGSGIPTCVGFTVCQQGPNLLSLAAGTLFIIPFWLWYGYLSRNDTASLFRRVFHLIGYGSSFIYVLQGVYRIFTLLLLTVLKIPVAPGGISGPSAQYDIISPLSLGLVTIGVYLFWLRRTALLHPTIKASITLVIQAITTAFMAVTFWWGGGLFLLNLLEMIAPSSTPLTAESWAFTIAFMLTGAGYIPLDILLRRRSMQTTLSLPLRGLVFALLGASILAIAIGGAVALYAYSTAILGSPLPNWQYTAHIGLAAFIIGVIVATLYLWTGMRSGILARQSKVSQSTQPVQPAQPVQPPVQAEKPVQDATEIAAITDIPANPTAPSATTLPVDTRSLAIGNVLDTLLAGAISRDEALARIEQLLKQTV